MKATKAAIIRQAQLAKKDIASGRVSTYARQAADTLADYSNAAFELLELALDEAAKEQPDTALVDSFIFLFGQASETLRLEIEAGYKTALDIAAKIRKRLVAASQTGASDPSTVLLLAQSFGAAKLDLGEELLGIVEHLIEQVGTANVGDGVPAGMLGFVADLVKQVNGDASAASIVGGFGYPQSVFIMDFSTIQQNELNGCNILNLLGKFVVPRGGIEPPTP